MYDVIIRSASYHIDLNMVITHMIGMEQPSVTQRSRTQADNRSLQIRRRFETKLYTRVFRSDDSWTLSTSVPSQKVDISKCPLVVHSMLKLWVSSKIHRFLSIFGYLLFRRCWRRIKCQFLRIFVRTSFIEGKTLYTYMARTTHFRKLTTHYITE